MHLDDVRSRIAQAGFTEYTIGRYKLASLLGCDVSKARRLLDRIRIANGSSNPSPVGSTIPTPVKQPAELRSETADSLQIELPHTRICTLEELIAHCQIDTDKYEVDRFVCNKWEVGAKDNDGVIQIEPLYQVKAWFKVRKGAQTLAFVKEEIERLREELHRTVKPFNINKKYSHSRNSSDALEISIADLHLGKLAWSPETNGAHYDLSIAKSMGERAFVDLLSRQDCSKLSKVVLVVGNDYINADNLSLTTTRGTPQSSDGRWHKLFNTGFDLLRKQIETVLEFCPVEVIVCPGNHDTHTTYGIAHSIESFFHGNRHVMVDNSPSKRKYWKHGNTVILFTHGDEEKPKDLPSILAAERPDFWGATEYREVHTGHKHQVNTFESFGVRVRIIPSLSPPDAWHSSSGYLGNVRAAQGFLWSFNDGLRAIYEFNVKSNEE